MITTPTPFRQLGKAAIIAIAAALMVILPSSLFASLRGYGVKLNRWRENKMAADAQ